MKRRAGAIKTGLMCCAIVLFALLAFFLTVKLPQVVPANADTTDFSAERGFEHVKAISVTPHPVGSASADTVMHYITDTLNSLGIKSEIQITTTNRKRDFAACKNIIAQIDGTEGRNTILLDAHYDSTDSSPAATDDSMGVAALLETVRALKAGAPLKNNIVFLFTSPEETGMHGVIAFLREHPLANLVNFALCVDNGGFSGPNFIKQTSRGNDWMIREFSKAAPNVIGNGTIQAFASDASDVAAFDAFGSNTLAYGITSDRRIHTPNDNLENFKPAVLQQMGDFTLSFARYFGNYNFGPQSNKGSVFFSFPPFGMISYPVTWVIPIMLVSVILFVFVIWTGFRKKMLTFKGISLGAVLQLLITLIVPAIYYFTWNILSKINNLGDNTALSHAYNEGLLFIIFIGFALAVITSGHLLLKKNKKGTTLDYAVGSLFVPCIGLIALSLIKPTASYILAIPLLLSCILIIWWIYSAKNDVLDLKPAQLTMLLINAIVAIFLFVPPIYIGLIGRDANTLLFLPAIFIGAITAFFAPHLNMIVRQFRWYVPLAFFAALAVSVSVVFTFSYSRQYPKLSSLFYIENADSGKAYWGGGLRNGSSYLDQWTAGFFPGERQRKSIKEAVPYFPFDDEYYLAPAPEADLTPPEVKVIDVEDIGSFKKYHMSIRSTRNAAQFELFLQKDSAEAMYFKVNGINYFTGVNDGYPPEYLLNFHGLPNEGIDVVITAKNDKPLKFMVIDHKFGLLQDNIPGIKPIPQNTILSSQLSNLSGYSVVIKAVELD